METVLTPIERLELVSRTLPHHVATLIWDVCADAKADAASVHRVRAAIRDIREWDCYESFTQVAETLEVALEGESNE